MTQPKFIDAPEQSLVRLRKIIPKRLHPLLRGLRKRFYRTFQSLEEPYYSVFPYTQAHPIRQENLLRLANKIETHNVPGMIVECGVLDGGTAALMAYATKQSGRQIHLFDSWMGLPSISGKDGKVSEVWANDVVGSEARVRAVMKHMNIDLNRVNFHKGWFDQTFSAVHIDQIALMHIDADFYDSVKLCLDRWTPHLTPGGYIQIDDYSDFIGCRRAVDEFLSLHPQFKLQTFGETTQAYFIEIPHSDQAPCAS